MRTRRVLVVEDNEANRLLALKQLERIGVQADAVGDGEEAVSAVVAGRFDLVLMDCNMPRLSGFDATQMIREAEAESGRHTIIVAMTAGAMEGDRGACIAAGMDDYLCKPVMMADLQGMVGRWFADEEAPPEVEGDVTPASGPDAGHLRRSPIDATTFEAFRESLGDDQFVASFVATFLSQLTVRLEALQTSAEAGDAAGLRFVAHTLKSTSAMLGAARLADLCVELESRTEGSRAGWTGTVTAIRREGARVRETLSPWNQRQGRAVA